MPNKLTLTISILALLFFITSCSDRLVYKSAKTKAQCNEKNGYWYKDQCWKEFDDDGISDDKIDAVVAEQMKIIEKSKFIFDNKAYRLVSFEPLNEDEGVVLVVIVRLDGEDKTLFIPTGMQESEDWGKDETIKTSILFFNGNAIENNIDESSKLNGTVTLKVINIDKLDIEFTGEIKEKDGETKQFSFTVNDTVSGAGSSVLEIKDGEAHLSGDLGTITYTQIKDLIKNHPDIKTIVLGHISGSVNDAVNMHTGRLIHENGFTTKVLADSDIASGGVDFFTAGKERIVEKGAKIGVHSWCCVKELTAAELPKDHPAHKYQLEYFTMTLGPQNGPAFYFYTLKASPFDSVHYMSDEEIKSWHVATKFVE